MIYVSTGGFAAMTFAQTATLFSNSSIKALELSAGKFCPNLLPELHQIASDFTIALHNYFPVPEIPFVFNLASSVPQIAEQSMTHAKRAIELSSHFGIPQYSFHAGYLLDPKVDELGKKISRKTLLSPEEGLSNFSSRVNELSHFAKQRNVKLLVENNVLSADNAATFSNIPLMAVGIDDTHQLFNSLDKDIKLLVDVAHLKVSANSLHYSATDYLTEFHQLIGGYHLSDNNGLEDNNLPFTLNSWFWPYIRRDLDYYTIEVYQPDVTLLENQYSLVNQFIGKGNKDAS